MRNHPTSIYACTPESVEWARQSTYLERLRFYAALTPERQRVWVETRSAEDRPEWERIADEYHGRVEARLIGVLAANPEGWSIECES
jgi:hypothetical protein